MYIKVECIPYDNVLPKNTIFVNKRLSNKVINDNEANTLFLFTVIKCKYSPRNI